MKLQMHPNSLFAVLLRSPAWISFAVALALFAVARFFLPTVYAVFVGLPFFVIGSIALWRQLQMPSAARVEATLAAVRGMSWPEFAAAIEEGFKREGYGVTRAQGAVDFELSKSHRTAVVVAKRWKSARTGVEPLRELHAEREAREAHESIYVAAGEVTEQALAFAKEKRIRVVSGVELARLLPRMKAVSKAAA